MPRGGSEPRLFVECGQRFGRLVVLDECEVPRGDRPSGTRRAAEVRCDCGAERVVSVYDLLCGHTTSCGCWHREIASAAATAQWQRRRADVA